MLVLANSVQSDFYDKGPRRRGDAPFLILNARQAQGALSALFLHLKKAQPAIAAVERECQAVNHGRLVRVGEKTYPCACFAAYKIAFDVLCRVHSAVAPDGWMNGVFDEDEIREGWWSGVERAQEWGDDRRIDFDVDELKAAVMQEVAAAALGIRKLVSDQTAATTGTTVNQETLKCTAPSSSCSTLEFGPGCFTLWGRTVGLSGKPREFLERIWSGPGHRLPASSLLDGDSCTDEKTVRAQVSDARQKLKQAIREKLVDYDGDPIPVKDRGSALAWRLNCRT